MVVALPDKTITVITYSQKGWDKNHKKLEQYRRSEGGDKAHGFYLAGTFVLCVKNGVECLTGYSTICIHTAVGSLRQ